MKTRQEIMRRISDLDQQINAELAQQRAPTLDQMHRRFPIMDWIAAAACFAWAQFGQMVPGVENFHAISEKWVFWIAILLAALAAFRTVLWLVKRPRGRVEGYAQMTERVRKLQDERRDLQLQLEQVPR